MFKPIRTLVDTIVKLAPFLHSDVFTAFWSFPSYRDHYLIVVYISSTFIALFYRDMFSIAHSIIRVLHFSTKKVLKKSANQVLCNGPSIFQKQAENSNNSLIPYIMEDKMRTFLMNDNRRRGNIT